MFACLLFTPYKSKSYVQSEFMSDGSAVPASGVLE